MGPQIALLWASVIEKFLSVLARFRFHTKKKVVEVDDKKNPKPDEKPADGHPT